MAAKRRWRPTRREAPGDAQKTRVENPMLYQIPSRELTYPTLGKGKSSSKCQFWGICSFPGGYIIRILLSTNRLNWWLWFSLLPWVDPQTINLLITVCYRTVNPPLLSNAVPIGFIYCIYIIYIYIYTFIMDINHMISELQTKLLAWRKCHHQMSGVLYQLWRFMSCFQVQGNFYLLCSSTNFAIILPATHICRLIYSESYGFSSWCYYAVRIQVCPKKGMGCFDHQFYPMEEIRKLTSWWFQPIWQIWVKLDHFPK